MDSTVFEVFLFTCTYSLLAHTVNPTSTCSFEYKPNGVSCTIYKAHVNWPNEAIDNKHKALNPMTKRDAEKIEVLK